MTISLSGKILYGRREYRLLIFVLNIVMLQVHVELTAPQIISIPLQRVALPCFVLCLDSSI